MVLYLHPQKATPNNKTMDANKKTTDDNVEEIILPLTKPLWVFVRELMETKEFNNLFREVEIDDFYIYIYIHKASIAN